MTIRSLENTAQRPTRRTRPSVRGTTSCDKHSNVTLNRAEKPTVPRIKMLGGNCPALCFRAEYAVQDMKRGNQSVHAWNHEPWYSPAYALVPEIIARILF